MFRLDEIRMSRGRRGSAGRSEARALRRATEPLGTSDEQLISSDLLRKLHTALFWEHVGWLRLWISWYQLSTMTRRNPYVSQGFRLLCDMQQAWISENLGIVRGFLAKNRLFASLPLRRARY